jgi:heterotetrameric sarcosine oxidase delta subunit
MILLPCPNCGSRNLNEFRYGGEVHRRPQKDEDSTAEWIQYIYMRDNKSGFQREWWYHREGCRRWFIVERDTKTQVVRTSYLWTSVDQA